MRLTSARRHDRGHATSSCTGELTDGGFVGFLLLVDVFFRPVEKINAVLEIYPKGIAGFRATSSSSTPSRTSPTRRTRSTSTDLRGDIRYEDVTLRLRGRQRRSCATST